MHSAIKGSTLTVTVLTTLEYCTHGRRTHTHCACSHKVWLCVAVAYLCHKLLTHDTQLVDPASVYMLVSKTKPCMPKYSSVGQLAERNRRRLIKSVVVYVGDSFPSWITVENPELIHAIDKSSVNAFGLLTGDAFIRPRRAHR